MLSSKLARIAQPTEEPVTLAQALVQCHADVGVEDEWFLSRITAGRVKVEDYTKRSLMPQRWVYTLFGSFGYTIDLPRSPVTGLVSVKHQTDERAEAVEINVDDIILMNEGCPAHIVIPANAHNSGVLRIEYDAGDADKIPQPLLDAILLYVSWGYNNREGEKDLPKAFFDLLEPYRLFMWGV